MEARELLINAALGDRAEITGALAQLAELEGEDVDQALMAVLRSGTGGDRSAALPRLLKTGHPEAIQLAIELAHKGSRNERYEAMRMLADSGTPRAFDALIDIASKSHGQTRVAALDMLARERPSDAALGQLLADSLRSGRREEASYAANVLARIGNDGARQALLGALSGKDKELASVVAASLGQFAMTDSVKTALLSASQSNPEVKQQVMNQLLS